MENLSQQIQDYLEKNDKVGQLERKPKDSFWPSEAESNVFDIYHKWMGTPPTNPVDGEKLLMFQVAKMAELAIINTLQDMGICKTFKDNEQLHFRIEREGVPISGYMDGIRLQWDGVIEVKTYYGYYQEKELEAGKPKTSYLKQLAIYMDAEDLYTGELLYQERGTGKMHEFDLVRERGTLKFKCGDIEFDLNDTYKKWGRLYKNNILPKLEPKSEYRYKVPIAEIDWSKIASSDISKARTNQKVISDSCMVQYSPYKNLIVDKENTCLGYTSAELAEIKKATAGYSTKKY